MEWDGPVLDNHLHLGGGRDRAREAVDHFVSAGGTHLLVVNKPSWWYDVAIDGQADFREGFDVTVAIVEEMSDRLPGRAWPILGVHPALISRLVDDRGLSPDRASGVMTEGIDLAAEYVEAGRAVGIKSGRPHYPVEEAVWEASNHVMRAAFDRAVAVDCAVQLHTESGDDFEEVASWASRTGLDPRRVVKHYADGPVSGPTPSVIARKEPLERAAENGEGFLMETDYLDDPDRPGAVLGPKTVPRRVDWLAEREYDDALRRAHVELPREIYGLELNRNGEN